ncbi:type I-E CRISPR-associated protein Cas5/CasD [Promicromonospora sp. NFX87]|uniref:type I-E CRISPR-associated protein Cas5/CasD n=1 Tax=Promicromonospora sp. NFX87 TaxID=3402691 RepID=UPI003AFAD9B7
MKTLLLRLAGPLQSWGVQSRFTRRTTERAPSKSGVLGMIAAAQGRRRTDTLTDLLGLRFAVRIDQPGRLDRDYQTARIFEGPKGTAPSQRFYLADAVFVAGIQGDDEVISGIEDALRRPAFPLYLGRRSCPPAGPVVIGTRADGPYQALMVERYHASPFWARKQPPDVELDLLADGGVIPVPEVREAPVTQRDVPLSFSPSLRQHDWRSVERTTLQLTNPLGRVTVTAGPGPFTHDPMTAFEEGD